jgi:hypothetical protein
MQEFATGGKPARIAKSRAKSAKAADYLGVRHLPVCFFDFDCLF